jgi:hypothetical protein
MGINRPSIRSIAVACAMTIGGLVAAGGAEASTVSTYTFTQDGYFSPTIPSGITGVLTGSFSGTVEDTGYIGQADLTDFSFALTLYDRDNNPFGSVITGTAADLAAFSYKPGSSSQSTLFISAKTPNGLCVGAAAAFGLCGGPTGYKGAFIYLSDGASVIPGDGQQAFLVTSNAPQIAQVATTPVPATLPLFASAIGALGLFLRRRRAQVQALAAA